MVITRPSTSHPRSIRLILFFTVYHYTYITSHSNSAIYVWYHVNIRVCCIGWAQSLQVSRPVVYKCLYETGSACHACLLSHSSEFVSRRGLGSVSSLNLIVRRTVGYTSDMVIVRFPMPFRLTGMVFDLTSLLRRQLTSKHISFLALFLNCSHYLYNVRAVLVEFRIQ